MSTDTHATVCVSRRFAADPWRVFGAWLDPGTIRKWIVAPSAADEVVDVETDPRPGGSYRFAVRRDGEAVEQTGEYLEVDEPRRLVFTWPAGGAFHEAGTVRIDVVRAPSGMTDVILAHDGIDDARRRDAERAWRRIFDAIADEL